MRDCEGPLRLVCASSSCNGPRPLLHSQEHIGYRVLPTGRRCTVVRLVAECAQRVTVSVASVGGLCRRFRHRPAEAGLRGLYVRSLSGSLLPRCEAFAFLVCGLVARLLHSEVFVGPHICLTIYNYCLTVPCVFSRLPVPSVSDCYFYEGLLAGPFWVCTPVVLEAGG